ncbi:MAG: GNAT family N-acetyltransferase [Alphaproteobacteria bacterium]|nr:GNAT family N-acetyltransferase [Alphaproteobacteria bacterium]
MALTIRDGTPQDAKQAHALMQALSVYEEAEADFRIDAAAFEEAAFSTPPKLGFMVAELDGGIVGVATYMRRFHIWSNSTIFLLDDLFVSPSSRGLGIGGKLLQALGTKAKAENAAIKWEVIAGNEDAIRFYKRIGARVTAKGICWWMPENMAG